MKGVTGLAAALLVAFAGAPAAAQGQGEAQGGPQAESFAPPNALAVFPMELWDTSGAPQKPDEKERLALATQSLVRALEANGAGTAVELGPFGEAIDKAAPLYKCDGCWLPIAKDAGARFAVVSTIHKASSLISSLDIAIVDVATAKTAAQASGQFRGDGPDEIDRSISFLVKGRLLTPQARAALAAPE
ncbi:DUF3280 domain-containing protein [Methylocella sp.]|uniref:DUF3280 domain-containing protein n=1 Tax=Methylocella sp. TaxID=1978226 RepID=UPI0035B46A09